MMTLRVGVAPESVRLPAQVYRSEQAAAQAKAALAALAAAARAFGLIQGLDNSRCEGDDGRSPDDLVSDWDSAASFSTASLVISLGAAGLGRGW